MRLLLDTHSLIWASQDSPTLSSAAREAIARDDSEVFMSVATIWELAIKMNRGKVSLPGDFVSTLLASGYELLEIEAAHAIAAGALPLLHRDPFDRMLVAQARLEDLTLVTRDAMIPRYGISCLLA